MDLRITESGAEHPQLPDFIHGGGVSVWMWEEQISYFQRVHCHGSPLAQPMLFNQILHDCLEGLEHLHAG
ncbi:hypothetical protein HC660_27660 [Bacillus mojavensis]|uniref:Uncharacterized protein n=1 Tax=Bacillus mojavensis TaxID=72360 RepID=A0ABX6LZC5_BACMO|nr:hypothetical protein [Bacillus mojavensis]QJC97239.1 hypothetical protein HC660_27660 [Bacillus mojavensis]